MRGWYNTNTERNMKTDEQKIAQALNVWANYIETGDAVLSAQDARRMGMNAKVKALDTHQTAIVARLRKLARLATDGKIAIQED